MQYVFVIRIWPAINFQTCFYLHSLICLLRVLWIQGELSDLGRVLMQGSFNVWINHRKGPTRMKDIARFKPMQRHLFLHERALLFCKKREENGEGHDRTASYSFKHCLMVRESERPTYLPFKYLIGQNAWLLLNDHQCRKMILAARWCSYNIHHAANQPTLTYFLHLNQFLSLLCCTDVGVKHLFVYSSPILSVLKTIFMKGILGLTQISLAV